MNNEELAAIVRRAAKHGDEPEVKRDCAEAHVTLCGVVIKKFDATEPSWKRDSKNYVGELYDRIKRTASRL